MKRKRSITEPVTYQCLNHGPYQDYPENPQGCPSCIDATKGETVDAAVIEVLARLLYEVTEGQEWSCAEVDPALDPDWLDAARRAYARCI